jgi:hypothetical protein
MLLLPVWGQFAMPGAASLPGPRGDLDDHPPPAVRAVPGRLPFPRRGTGPVRVAVA